MLCHDLLSIWRDDERENFSPRNLDRGARFTERQRTDMVGESLRTFHFGKAASMMDMLGGGNGFPPAPRTFSYADAAIFDAGSVNERRDQRSWIVWSQSLTQCMADIKKGVVS
jgi:hypothetical protein